MIILLLLLFHLSASLNCKFWKQDTVFTIIFPVPKRVPGTEKDFNRNLFNEYLVCHSHSSYLACESTKFECFTYAVDFCKNEKYHDECNC